MKTRNEKTTLALLTSLLCLVGCTNNYEIGTTGSAGQANVQSDPATTSGTTSGTNTGTSTTGTGTSGGSTSAVESLSVTASPAIVVKGSSSVLTIVENDLTDVTYSCSSVQTGTVLAHGDVDQTALKFSLPISEDTLCTFQGVNSNSPNAAAVTTQVNVGVDCANQIKVGGQCQDFACKSLVTLTSASDLMTIPARTADGICYAYKMASAIPVGASNLTTTIDTQVISRNHDSGSGNPAITHNPYEMGLFQGQFNLLGGRVVKLSGGPDATTHILVDNFVLMGVYPSATGAPADLTTAYQAMGTSDSSIANAQGVDTHSISFMNQLIPVLAFATGGTSSVAPVDITVKSPPNQVQTLDIRALDCGGSRNMSDIYILFQ